jgi:hypothetical protein
MKENKNKYLAGLTLALAIFVISPADDVIVATLFGTALFGFGSTAFYAFLVLSSTVSITFWMSRRHRKEQNSQPTLPSIKSP